jgi:hypothetical protein
MHRALPSEAGESRRSPGRRVLSFRPPGPPHAGQQGSAAWSPARVDATIPPRQGRGMAEAVRPEVTLRGPQTDRPDLLIPS